MRVTTCICLDQNLYVYYSEFANSSLIRRERERELLKKSIFIFVEAFGMFFETAPGDFKCFLRVFSRWILAWFG